MTAEDASTTPSVDESLANLEISQPVPQPVIAPEPESNPWRDSARNSPVRFEEHGGASHITISDLAVLDPSTARGLAAEEDTEPPPRTEPVKQEILEEFDPLASQEEKEAKEAWENAESHPPPPPSAPNAEDARDRPPPVPAKNGLVEPPRPASPLASFPSLVALARTFALPALPSVRQRPQSIDTAANVPSPATLSSFASQQQVSRAPVTPAESRSSTPILRSKSSDTDPTQFDFQRFLDQMKMKGAEPVAKYLRSFLSNFAKRTFTVSDQVKLISDFLSFISAKMRDCEVWRQAGDAEFENAMEGMEKLVMNRLYDFTFTPQVARMIPPRPITEDDLERDRVLEQRIALFKWIEPYHLDIPEGHGREGFLMFAQQELLKVNHYKAPRDKLICILNCCKVIFGLIRHLQKDEGADNFIPILIYVVLKSNPEHLLSNVEFINRFRNPAKLQSEAGYYLSSLMGAVSFIETMDHTSLSNITQEEFERNVEDAIQSLPTTGTHTPDPDTPITPATTSPTSSLPLPSSHTGEESAQPLALPAPSQTLTDDAKRLIQRTGDTISKPLSAIGRIFSEVLDNAEESLASLAPFDLGKEFSQQYGDFRPRTPGSGTVEGPSSNFTAQQQAHQAPYKPRVRRTPSPNPPALPAPEWGTQAPDDTPIRPRVQVPYTNQALAMGPSQPVPRLQPMRVQNLVQSDRALRDALRTPSPHGVSRTPTPNLDIAGMQEEIDRVYASAAAASRETLKQIFPDTDVEIMDWVLEANGGDLGKSIEALLEISSGG